tara:strand:+ start:308 stop:712 length:405 start_codon:yes stop_codon:yes gene_type:complete
MHETSSEEETVEDLDSDEYIETKGKKKIASGGQTQTNKKPSKGKASPVKRATNKDQIVYHTDSDESSDGDASDFKSAFAKRNTLVKANHDDDDDDDDSDSDNSGSAAGSASGSGVARNRKATPSEVSESRSVSA